jgi:periplasmic protein TonB
MKPSSLLVLLLLFCIPAFAQVDREIVVPVPPPPLSTDEAVVYTIVEEMPEFPGGEDEMLKFIKANIKYPEIALKYGIRGTVYMAVIIDKGGRLTEISIKRGIGGGCDEEAIRVLSTMPVWKPGKNLGQTVNVIVMIPVKFTL